MKASFNCIAARADAKTPRYDPWMGHSLSRIFLLPYYTVFTVTFGKPFATVVYSQGKQPETVVFILLPSPLFNEGLLLQERICSLSKFFPVRVDPFSEGLRYPRKQTRSRKSCFPLVKLKKKYGGITMSQSKLLSFS